MMYVTHLAFASLAFILLSKYIHGSIYIALSVCLIASVIADIDHHKSKVGRKLPILSRIIESVFSHRGFIHSLLFAMILFITIYFTLLHYSISVYYAYAFLIGYLSHLLIDSLNPQGVAWLHPFSKHRLRGFINTNSFGEKAILLVIFLVIITFAVRGV